MHIHAHVHICATGACTRCTRPGGVYLGPPVCTGTEATHRRWGMSAAIDYSEYGWREKVAKSVVREVKAGIDAAMEKLPNIYVEYPTTISIDGELFLWDELTENTP